MGSWRHALLCLAAVPRAMTDSERRQECIATKHALAMIIVCKCSVWKKTLAIMDTDTQARSSALQSVQTFGRKKTASAVAFCKSGVGILKVNGRPIELVQPELMREKVMEPIKLLGEDTFAKLDIRVRVKGGGHTSQIYAIRQAISKAVVAFYQKYVDESSKEHLKAILMNYDRTLLVADPRRCEPKKFGGPGARARYQKSYR